MWVLEGLYSNLKGVHMKKLILALALMASTSSLAAGVHDHNHDHGSETLEQSLVTLGTLSALENFESLNQGPVLAFETTLNDDETATTLHYQNSANTVVAAGYDCHFHTHGDHQDAHCHGPADLGVVRDSSTPAVFGVDQLLQSLNFSADIFSRKVSAMNTVSAVKMWQVSNEVYVSLTYTAADSSSQKSHFMCHVHGDHFDCHRSRNPGPQEPAL